MAFNSKDFSLFPFCKVCIVLGTCIGPFAGLSTKQLMLPAPHGRKRKKENFMLLHSVIST